MLHHYNMDQGDQVGKLFAVMGIEKNMHLLAKNK